MTYARTVSGIANLGKPRARQSVRVLTKRFGGAMGPRYTVLVDAEYYEVGQHILDALEAGSTPEWLELEPFNPADEVPEYPADDRASSAADLAFQLDQERI